MNSQPILKQLPINTSELLVHSVFYTIQGEGPFVGKPAIFIRLGGCNLQCPQCDTEYTNFATDYYPESLVQMITDEFPKQAELIVITGGEPFRQNIGPLISQLLIERYQVQIETNGTLYNDDVPFGHPNLTIVCSPKAGTINRKLEQWIDAFKYVLDSEHMASDGLPTTVLGNSAIVARPPETFQGTIYLQPIDSKNPKLNARNLVAAKESCLTHGYTLGMQIHKLIGVE